MRILAFFLVTALCASIVRAAPPAASTGHAAPPLMGERVLWLGDSITQAGDYVTFTEYYLQKNYPTDSVNITSIGRSSETASGLSEKTHPFKRPCIFERLLRALDVTKPKIVIACYGMNDGIYHPFDEAIFSAFQDGIQKLVTTVRSANAKILLLTPPPFDAHVVKSAVPATAPDFAYNAPYQGYDTVLDAFARWEASLKAANVGVIDLHGPMDAYVANRRRESPEFSLSKDGVHPTLLGHLLMAHVILHALDVAVPDEADLEHELATIEADPLYPLIKKKRETRSNAWLAYVGLPGAVEQAENDVSGLQGQIDKLRRAGTP